MNAVLETLPSATDLLKRRPVGLVVVETQVEGDVFNSRYPVGWFKIQALSGGRLLDGSGRKEDSGLCRIES